MIISPIPPPPNRSDLLMQASNKFGCFFQLPMPHLTPIPPNYSSLEIVAALCQIFMTVSFYNCHASFLTISGNPDNHLTMDHITAPSSAQTLQHLIRLNNFLYLLRGIRNLNERIVKGRIHLRTCKVTSVRLNLIETSHAPYLDTPSR